MFTYTIYGILLDVKWKAQLLYNWLKPLLKILADWKAGLILAQVRYRVHAKKIMWENKRKMKTIQYCYESLQYNFIQESNARLQVQDIEPKKDSKMKTDYKLQICKSDNCLSIDYS